MANKPDPTGLAPRRAAHHLLMQVTDAHRLLSEAIGAGALDPLAPPDRARAQRLATETLRGLNKLQINEQVCRDALHDSPELLAEPIQTILKTVGVDDPYTLLKGASRGQKPTRESLMALVDGLDIDEAVKARIHQLQTIDYIGDAVRICDLVLAEAKAAINA